MTSISASIVANLLSEFLIVVIGVLFANFIKTRIDDYRYGGWRVTVIDSKGAEHTRAISPKKTQQILAIPEDKSVFLKGVASAYGRINCDLITEGVALGLLTEDRNARRFVIDMRKNPPPADSPAIPANNSIL